MKSRELRRAARVLAGPAIGVVAVGVLAAGWLDPSPGGIGLPQLLGFAALSAGVAWVVAQRLRTQRVSERAKAVSFWLAHADTFADVEVSIALVVGTHAVLAMTGGPTSPLHPLLYGVVAFSMTFQSRAASRTTVLLALVLELILGARYHFSAQIVTHTSLHVAFIAAAACLHALFLRGFFARVRQQHERKLRADLRSQVEAARDYRLIASTLGAESRGARTREEEVQLLATSGAQSISSNIYTQLSMLKRAIAADTCVLLWLRGGGDELYIRELITDGDDVIDTRHAEVSGVVGALVRDRKPLLVQRPRPGQVSYLRPTAGSYSFCGVPVLDGPHVRGALCANRPGSDFSERELAALEETATQIIERIRDEHVFRSLERSKYEHERFYQASALLCEALTIEQVVSTVFDATQQISDYDVAVVTIYDEETRRHRVHSARVQPGGEGLIDIQSLSGLEFRSNSGLVSMVVKNKHFLPSGGEVRDTRTPIYTKKIRYRDAESLIVLPLISADSAIGTLMLMSRDPDRFGKDIREMLLVIAKQVGVSLQNAMMYKKMETMATTDGLTGLTNHRTFQVRFTDLLERARRHSHPAAMLLVDVDHFKNVNDTYGHPVGDEVLRRVAAVLRAATRKIDIPARYGGEEFAVVLEETDLTGAIHLAERIREDIASMVLNSDKGAFRVTVSIGVAAFPDDSSERGPLIERADHALYHAKESGRNRVVSYGEFASFRKRASAQ